MAEAFDLGAADLAKLRPEAFGIRPPSSPTEPHLAKTPSRSNRPFHRAAGSGRQCLRLDRRRETSFDLLDRFAGAGLNAIDTADAYSRWVPGHKGGESETIIGKWMKSRGNRDKVVVITKVGSDMGQGKKDLSAAYIERAVEASLKRLQTDAIDLYLSHWPDPTTPYEETLGAYEKLLAAGKVRHIGASNLDAGQLRAALDVASLRGCRAMPCCSRNTISTTAPPSTGRCMISARPRISASSPISLSPRGSSAASTAARPISAKACVAAG